MRLFSIEFLLRSASLGIKYPSLLIDFLKGKDVGVELQKRRREDWAGLAENYRNKAKTVFGLKIYLNPEDFSPVSSSIGTVGRLDLSLTELVRKVLKPGMIAVDIGANIGYYTLLFAQVVGNSGAVYAFEPEPFNFQLLSKSTRINDLSNVRIYNEALSETTGATSLHLSDARMPQAHSLSRDWGKGTVEVFSTTLDEFWESLGRPRFDLVKIHVGDDDFTVLRGARRLLGEARPPMITMVFIRDKWRENSDLVRDMLAQYDVYRLIHSPFLIRRVGDLNLLGDRPVEIFLAPRTGPRNQQN